DGLFDLSSALFHADDDLKLVLGGEVLEVRCLARTDADGRKLGADVDVFGLGRREPKREVEEFKELDLGEILVELGEVDGRRSGWRRPFQIGGKRLNLVAVLDLDHIVDVGGIEELGAIDGERKLCARAEDPSDVGGNQSAP